MRRRLPETVELLTFVVAVEEESLARAGRRLHLSTPAVAKRIDNLEAVVGAKLLERGPRGVQLTAAGRRFHGRAARLLDQAEALLDGRDPDASTGARFDGLLGPARRRSPVTLLADLETVLGHVLEAIPDGVVLQRLPGAVVVEVNQPFCALAERPRETLLGRPATASGLWLGEPAEEPFAALGDRTRRGTVQTRAWLLTGPGEIRRLDVRVRRVELGDEDLLLVCVPPPATAG